MKAIYRGHISIEQNAIFAVERERFGFVVSEKHYELKDGINYDQFIIGEEYEIDGLVK